MLLTIKPGRQKCCVGEPHDVGQGAVSYFWGSKICREQGPLKNCFVIKYEGRSDAMYALVLPVSTGIV